MTAVEDDGDGDDDDDGDDDVDENDLVKLFRYILLNSRQNNERQNLMHALNCPHAKPCTLVCTLIQMILRSFLWIILNWHQPTIINHYHNMVNCTNLQRTTKNMIIFFKNSN